MLVFCLLLLASAAAAAPSEPRLETRIVKGQPVATGELPYQVSVQFYLGDLGAKVDALSKSSSSLEGLMNMLTGKRDKQTTEVVSNKKAHFCGGSYMEDKDGNPWVLTAAHCTLHQKADGLAAVMGTTDLTDADSPAFRVKRMIVHEYDDHNKKGDLALLQLEPNDASLSRMASRNVKPIKLAEKGSDFTHKLCTISGWGRLKSHGQTSPEQLLKAQVVIVDEDKCKKMYESKGVKTYPWDNKEHTMICAGGEDIDACQGDSGGPLMCEEDDGTQVLYGVTSWGIGCATPGYPGAFTNIRHFLDWINDTIENARLEQLAEWEKEKKKKSNK